MSRDGVGKDSPGHGQAAASASVEYLLFDSLVHHLIEKGLLTRNDALSIVQSAAEVVRGRLLSGDTPPVETNIVLGALERTYSSFAAVPDRRGATRLDGNNVRSLRPPLHGDLPKFPLDD